MNATPQRRRLPNRRASETFDVESCGLRFTVTASHFDDHRLADNHKADSTAGIIALQFGCPVETLRKALEHDAQGRTSSPLGAALDLLQEQNNQAEAL
jgi:hypothetical protein